MRKMSILILAYATSHCVFAGLQKINFFQYKVSYKNALGLTRHKDYIIPLWDDNQSISWIGSKFMGETPIAHSGSVASWGNGVEWLAMPTKNGDIRSLWVNKNNGQYGDQNAVANEFSSHPYLSDVRATFATDDGYLYAIQPDGWSLISGKIDQSSSIMSAWNGRSEIREYVGISAINDNDGNRPISLGRNGYLYQFSKDLSRCDSTKVFDTLNFHPLLFKGDGKVGNDGIAYYWSYGLNGSGKPSLCKIVFDISTNSINSRVSNLSVPKDVGIKAGVYSPLTPWNDFIPFWISDNDVRIISIANDYVNTFSDDGILIESSFGTDRTSDKTLNPWMPRNGDIYIAKIIMTTNNRQNWVGHQDILVADDFAMPGHGISRFTYTPDGFDDHISLDVKMKDASNSAEPISRPVISISNLSNYRQLSDFKLRIWTARASVYPDTIFANKYWMADDSAIVETGCSAENPNLCWVDVVFSDEYILNQNSSTKEDAIQLGFHNSSWKVWDKNSDISLSGVSGTISSNPNLTVYQKGAGAKRWIKVWGIEPKPNTIEYPLGWTPGPPPINKSDDVVLNFSQSNAWGSVPNDKIQLATGECYDGSGCAVMKQGGYALMESVPFKHQGSLRGLDLTFMQNASAFPYWKGQFSLYLESKSNGLFNQWLGYIDLSSQTSGTWNHAQLPIPEWISSRLGSAPNDLTLRVAINLPNDCGDFYFGKIRINP